MDLTEKDFRAWVEDALKHYHDLIYLGQCPLAVLEIVQNRLDPLNRCVTVEAAIVLQQVLDEAFDALWPTAETDIAAQQAASDARKSDLPPRLRMYAVLDLTFRKELPPQRIYDYKLDIGHTQYYRDRSAGLSKIAAHLWNLQTQLRPPTPTKDATEINWRAHLPPPTYTRLFGIEALLAQALELLATPDRQRFIVLDGLGGMGKTALARELALTAMEAGLFTDLTWETAQRQIFGWAEVQLSTAPALTVDALLNSIARQTGNAQLTAWPSTKKREALHALLHAQPYLVVVDNLETAADYRALAEELWALTGPSKVLITSRYSLTAYEHATSIHLRALPPAAATAFVRYYAQERGDTALHATDEESLARIYQATGGNPLALKLVVGQAALRPLPQVLVDIEQARGNATHFYRFIYWAAWELLSPTARQLLLSLPLLAVTGGPWEALVAIGGLDERQTAASVSELAQLSLLEIGGDAHQRNYSIHPLTRQFILSELVQHAPDASVEL